MPMQYNATMSGGTAWGAVNGFLTAFAVALLGSNWNRLDRNWGWWHDRFGPFPIWFPMAVAAAAAVAAVLVGNHRGTTASNIRFRAGCWLGAGVWTTVTIHYGWSVIGFVILTVAAVLAGTLAPAFGTFTPPPQPSMDSGSEITRLTRLINKFANIKPEDQPTLQKVRDWEPKDAGVTYKAVGAPGTDFSWRTLREIQIRLAAGLGLPEGCPVQSEPAGTTQNEALVMVSTRNYLAEDVWYPMDMTPLTVTEDFPVGRFLDSAPTDVELRQAAGVVVGQRGGGKTMLLHNITASLIRMPDVVVWHIDLNGGGLSAPWTMPVAMGEVQYPGVDWVASTPEEALIMAEVALAIAKDRKRRYAGELVRSDDDVLPVRPGLPKILIIVDESAEVTGEDAKKKAQAVSAALQEVQRIGRAMCVDVFFSVLRGTGDLLPAGIKKQAVLSFCTRVRDESELAFVFDWKSGLDHEALKEPGQMYMQRGSGAVKMFKGFRLKPSMMIAIVHAMQHVRAQAQLDGPALRVAGDAYLQRWQRPDAVAYLAGLRGEDGPDPGDGGGGGYGGPPDPDPDPYSSGGDPGDDALAEFDAAIREIEAGEKPESTRPAAPVREAAPAAPAGSIPDDVVQRMLNQIEALPTTEAPLVDPAPAATTLAGPGLPGGPDQASTRGPVPRRAFIEQLLERAGRDGMRTGDIVRLVMASGLKVRREATIKEDLQALLDAGVITRNNPDGGETHGMYWLSRLV
jgi:S-DNA-T family DNA segregation ATPase FtsK/SpoIIIE